MTGLAAPGPDGPRHDPCAPTRRELLAQLLGAGGLLWFFGGHLEVALLLVWGGLFGLAWGWRLSLLWRGRRVPGPSVAGQSGPSVVACGLVWALASGLLAGRGEWTEQLVLLLLSALVLLWLAWLGQRCHQGWQQSVLQQQQDQQQLQQLRAEKAAAEQARQRAEAADRAKTQFFQAASHDLRQPLHALGLFAWALRQQEHDSATARLAQSISQSVEALEGLFTELLDLTRLQSGGYTVHAKEVELGGLFSRLRGDFEVMAFDKGLDLHFIGARHRVWVDPALLERVLRNLLANAIRYTEDGGVLLSCRPRGGQMLLQVWDTGVGMDARALEHIFEEFYQVDRPAGVRLSGLKGLGLGLAIVKRLTEVMQLPISVRSRLGHGSVFSLLLPTRQPDDPDALPPGR